MSAYTILKSSFLFRTALRWSELTVKNSIINGLISNAKL
jgi:hypothetical protein